MRFWRLDHPDYDSDYRDSYINGSLKHPLHLPGVGCDNCGAVYSGCRVLPYTCPEEMRDHKNLLKGWPIPRPGHTILQQELMARMCIDGVPFVDLKPGDSFQPGYLSVPSRPRADFLWPGLGSFCVSDQMRDVLVKHCGNDLAMCPVVLKKIGKQNAKLPPPMPSTGEPEDLIDEVPTLMDPNSALSYSEVIVLHESGLPPGVSPDAICPTCKRETVGSERELRMTTEMWNGQSIFLMATTLYVIVTDELKRAIERYRPTNVTFKPI